jgi:acyl homoserine lactone synthase/acyl-homoserine lactone synthase
MFAARKRVFVDLLGWDVPVIDGTYEIDQFDSADAVYLIVTDRENGHLASARLLRTDQPHILGDLFPFLCDGEMPRGKSVREITRFCIEPALPAVQRRLARNHLITALTDHALANDLSRYTAVASRIWFGQIAKFGWRCTSLGASHVVNGETLVGLRIDIDERTPDDLGARGIYCPANFRATTIAPEEVL